MMSEVYVDEETDQALKQAGDITMLLVQRYVVETLHRQAREESRDTGGHVSAGQVLGKALRFYLEHHGKPEAVDYLHALAEAE